MKKINLVLLITFLANFVFAQIDLYSVTNKELLISTPLVGNDFVKKKSTEFKYDGTSGFVFLLDPVLSIDFPKSWNNLSNMERKLVKENDKLDYNESLKEVLKNDFSLPYVLMPRISEIKGKSYINNPEILTKDRYVFAYTEGWGSNHGGTSNASTKIEYFIFDLHDKVKYPVKDYGWVNAKIPSKLITIINEMIQQ